MALRKTQTVLVILAGLGLVLTGCGGAAEAPPYRPPLAGTLPAPAPDRIEYKPETRTLTFYDLPGTARWMVRLELDRPGIPAGPELEFPEGVDPDFTFVYYTRPGGHQSGRVSLAEIQAAGTMHASQIR